MKIQNFTFSMYGFLLALAVAALDQLSKNAVIATVTLSSQNEITSFFNCVLVFNKGISFGMLGSGAPDMIARFLPVLLSLIVGVLCIWLVQTRERNVAIALGFIIGGATGNLFDRFVRGAVIDFLDFHIGHYHWPAFNLADSAIFIGVVIFLFGNIVSKGNPKEEIQHED